MKYYTSYDNGHRHSWSKNKKITSIDSEHSHKVDLKKKLALKGQTDHTHRLIIRRRRKRSSSY